MIVFYIVVENLVIVLLLLYCFKKHARSKIGWANKYILLKFKRLYNKVYEIIVIIIK